MCMVTHWIYYGDRLVTGVRAPHNATDKQVKLLALKKNLNIPQSYRPTECPGDKARLITLGNVRTFYVGVDK